MDDLRSDVADEFAAAQRLSEPSISSDAFLVAYAIRMLHKRKEKLREVDAMLRLGRRGGVPRVVDLAGRRSIPLTPRVLPHEHVQRGTIHLSSRSKACPTCGRTCASTQAARFCCR